MARICIIRIEILRFVVVVAVFFLSETVVHTVPEFYHLKIKKSEWQHGAFLIRFEIFRK